MNESLLDVLMYLFENYFEDEVVLGPDQETVKLELSQAGFPETVINRAFNWLEGLAHSDQHAVPNPSSGLPSVRLFAPPEQERLSVECRGFLLFLEQAGVLDPVSRELAIDRVLALGDDDIDLDQVKWVVQMVLFNQPDKVEAFAWVDDLVLDQALGRLH
jgi:Smg protein